MGAPERKNSAKPWPKNFVVTRRSWVCSMKAAWACTTPSSPMKSCIPRASSKERLSQSALYYETTQVSDDEAHAVRKWYTDKGLKFVTGSGEEEHLTDKQDPSAVQDVCRRRPHCRRLRLPHHRGIQYQQGLKDLMPASDLVEGTLNNTDRPPVKSRDGSRVLYANQPIPHFNEVDECAGLDGLMTYRIHKAMGQPVENTLHDLRWGDADRSGTVKEYVWVFLISGLGSARRTLSAAGPGRHQ